MAFAARPRMAITKSVPSFASRCSATRPGLTATRASFSLGETYTDPQGRFTCRAPAGWQVKAENDGTKSSVTFSSGGNEIRVLARTATKGSVSELDDKLIRQDLDAVIAAAKSQGRYGRIVGVSREKRGETNTIGMEFEFAPPKRLWVRQMKFIERGHDHVLGQYVASIAERPAYEKLFAEFLDAYRFQAGP